MAQHSNSMGANRRSVRNLLLLSLCCWMVWALSPVHRAEACASPDDCPPCFCGGTPTCSGGTSFVDGTCGCNPADDCLSFCCSCEQLNDPTGKGCLPSQCEDSKGLLSTVGCALLCAGSNLLTSNECGLTVTRDQDCEGPQCAGATGCCEFTFSIGRAQEMGVMEELEIDESQLPLLDDVRTCLQSDEGSCPTVFSQDLFNFVPGGTCDPVDGSCRLPLGEACTAPTECVSGFCEQGVCCETACDGPLEACNVSGSEGMCIGTAATAPTTSSGGLVALISILALVGMGALLRRHRSNG